MVWQAQTQTMATQAQTDANRANAQLSTGPTTDDGKATCSKNALKTGLTGRTVLLPSDEPELYGAHIEQYMNQHNPVGDAERELVQAIADTSWRLARIPSLEAGVYALGRLEFAELFPEEDPGVRKQLIEAKIFLAYQRQLKNLSLQEGRLRRQREQDIAKLKELQKEREDKRQQRLTEIANQYRAAVHAEEEFDFDQFGSEFTVAEIELRALDIEPLLFAEWAAEQEALKQQRRRKAA